MKRIEFKKSKSKRRQSSSKSPRVSRTRSYYGFSQDFPGEADDKGYRDNTGSVVSLETKRSSRKFFTLLFICVFIASFVIFYIGLGMSKYPASDITAADSPSKSSELSVGGAGVWLSVRGLYSSDIDKLCASLKQAGVAAVMLDVKDSAGYLAFKPDDITRLTAGSLQYASDNFPAIVRKFSENGISVSAVFNCYADTFASSYLSDFSVRNSGDKDENGNRTGSLWYDDSYESRAWLDPFTDGVNAYLDAMLSYVADSGVNEIVLSSASIPECTNFDSAYFGEKADRNAVNEKMAQFVSSSIDKYAAKVTVSCFTSLSSVLSSAETKNCLLDTKCSAVYVDMRLSRQPDNMVIDSNTFEKPAEKSYMFISNAAYACGGIIARNNASARMVPIIEAQSDDDKQVTALLSHDIKLYYLYNKDSSYFGE